MAPEAQTATPSDSLPNQAGDKYAALRKEAVDGVLSGKFKPEQKNGSTVVKVGKVNNKDQYVELDREKTDKIFVVLAEFGDERHPTTRTRTPTRPSPARPGSTGREQRDPGARPHGGQLDRVAAGLQPRTTTGTCTSARPAASR